MTRALALLAVALVMGTAQATQYYVTTTGNDTNTCLGPDDSEACLTVDHVFSTHFGSGDDGLLVGLGSFTVSSALAMTGNDTFAGENSGTEITFAPGASLSIDGDDMLVRTFRLRRDASSSNATPTITVSGGFVLFSGMDMGCSDNVGDIGSSFMVVQTGGIARWNAAANMAPCNAGTNNLVQLESASTFFLAFPDFVDNTAASIFNVVEGSTLDISSVAIANNTATAITAVNSGSPINVKIIGEIYGNTVGLALNLGNVANGVILSASSADSRISGNNGDNIVCTNTGTGPGLCIPCGTCDAPGYCILPNNLAAKPTAWADNDACVGACPDGSSWDGTSCVACAVGTYGPDCSSSCTTNPIDTEEEFCDAVTFGSATRSRADASITTLRSAVVGTNDAVSRVSAAEAQYNLLRARADAAAPSVAIENGICVGDDCFCEDGFTVSDSSTCQELGAFGVSTGTRSNLVPSLFGAIVGGSAAVGAYYIFIHRGVASGAGVRKTKKSDAFFSAESSSSVPLAGEKAAEKPAAAEAPKAAEKPAAAEAPKAEEKPAAPEAPKAEEKPAAPEAPKTEEAPKAE